jgi:hypothetical protein
MQTPQHHEAKKKKQQQHAVTAEDEEIIIVVDADEAVGASASGEDGGEEEEEASRQPLKQAPTASLVSLAPLPPFCPSLSFLPRDALLACLPLSFRACFAWIACLGR